MSLAIAFRDLKFDLAPPDLPPLSEQAKGRVFTHPLATAGKAHAIFEIPSPNGAISDYENDAAVGRLLASASILKLIHTKYPLLMPSVAKTIVDTLLSTKTLSTISDHYKLIDDLRVPSSADKSLLIDTAFEIRSQIFFAYIGALSTAGNKLAIIQGIFGPLIEAEYKHLKKSPPAASRPPSPSSTIARYLAEPEVEDIGIDESFNYIGLLLEMQAKPRSTGQRVAIELEYTEPTSRGADHLRVWTAGMRLDGQIIAEATRCKKKDAKNTATGLALLKLGLLSPGKGSKRARLG